MSRHACRACKRPFLEITEQWVDKPNPRLVPLLEVCIKCAAKHSLIKENADHTNEPLNARKSGHYLVCGDPKCYAIAEDTRCFHPNWTKKYAGKQAALSGIV